MHATRASEIHNPDQGLALPDHDHSVRRHKSLVADAGKALLRPQGAQHFGVESYLFFRGVLIEREIEYRHLAQAVLLRRRLVGLGHFEYSAGKLLRDLLGSLIRALVSRHGSSM